MEIIKQYKITNWCNYEEVDQVGKTFGAPFVIPAYVSANGYVVTTEQWLNEETGDGWEVRKFQVQNKPSYPSWVNDPYDSTRDIT